MCLKCGVFCFVLFCFFVFCLFYSLSYPVSYLHLYLVVELVNFP